MSDQFPVNSSGEKRGEPSRRPTALLDPKLLACRDMAMQLLVQSLDGFFSRLEEDLLDQAEHSTHRAQRDSFFAAGEQIQGKRTLIAAEFRQHFLEAFDKRLQELDSGRAQAFKPVIRSAELSLVANDEYEENLTVTNVANTFKQQGGEALQQLESRLARLLPRRQEGEEGVNPISPEAICEAMLAACRQIECTVDARIVALRAFEQQLSSQVAAVYKQVNEFLMQQNVQPLTLQLRQRTPGARAPSAELAPGGGQAQPGAAAAAEVAPGMVQVSLPALLATHLEQLLSGSFQAASTLPPSVRLSTELGFLNQLQHRLPDEEEEAEVEGVVMHPARDNLVALLQNTQWAQNLAQMDAMTLNLVALLFDRLFEDSRLPDAIKGLIGRLQIPLLKVALLDSTFFARKNHPARQLVDRLAETAVDWSETPGAMASRFDRLSAIVSWVVVNFESDVEIFERALTDLESFLLDEADAAADQVLEDVEALAATEQAELAQATAEAVIGGRLFRRELPSLVEQFVRQTWMLALVAAYGPQGECEPRFVAYVTALDELLWSVEPKRGPEERLQLVNCLPGMLKALEEGAEAAGLSAEARQLFFSELVHCHAAAIRNGMRPPAELPVLTRLAEPPPQSVPLSTEVPGPAEEGLPLAADAMPQRWDWVELQAPGVEPQRLRLTWVSPQGTRYLFTSREGGNGRTFQRAEVEQLLQQGLMSRVGVSESLTDDVFSALRQSLTV